MTLNRLFAAAAIAALLVPGYAMAQAGPPRDRDNGGRTEQNRNPGANPGRPGGAVTLPARPGNRPDYGNNRPGRPDYRPGRPGNGPGYRPPSRPPQFSWRGQYRPAIRGPQFTYPRGYSYRRWSIGALLPSLFLGSQYFYDDYRLAGLDRPPPGRRWVRQGPDLVLVNVRTRRVEDVVYNVFY